MAWRGVDASCAANGPAVARLQSPCSPSSESRRAAALGLALFAVRQHVASASLCQHAANQTEYEERSSPVAAAGAGKTSTRRASRGADEEAGGSVSGRQAQGRGHSAKTRTCRCRTLTWRLTPGDLPATRLSGRAGRLTQLFNWPARYAQRPCINFGIHTCA